MRKPRAGRHLSILLACCCGLAAGGSTGAALAQEGAAPEMVIDRGLTEDVPYTAIYPKLLSAVDDGNAETVLTLQHPGAILQCDAFIVAGAEEDWTPEAALASLDAAGIESTWAPDFPGFTLVSREVTSFASGPALLYEGESDNSPLGVPIRIVHAEARDGSRTYAFECILDRSIAAEARPMIDFMIANFSTRSDGECCITPDSEPG